MQAAQDRKLRIRKRRYKVAGFQGRVAKDQDEVVQGCRLPRTGSLKIRKRWYRLRASQDR